MKKLVGFLAFVSLFMLFLCVHVSAESQYSENLIPQMTGSNSPSPCAASAYNTYSGFSYLYPWGSFNHDYTDNGYWASTITQNNWLKFDWGAGNEKKITKYVICNFSNYSIYGKRMPKDWRFEGSNDDTNWTVLDTRSNETNWPQGAKNAYTFNNTTAYRYYRIFILSNNGEDTLDIPEMEMMETIGGTTVPSINVNSQDLVKVGDQFTADIVLNNVTNICAEDVKINYDTTMFDYVGTQDITGLKIYSSSQTSPGALRFIVASLGKDNAANGQKAILKLVFKAKAIGQGKIDVVKGRIADNGTLEMDVAAENCGEKLITVQGKDVNRTGDFTLLDLAIDAWYYGDPAANTDTTKYDADVAVNGNIDDADLSVIVTEMLKNANYAPNI